MDTVTIEGGAVLANLQDRTITGRLIPFNEEGRTNLGRFTVEAGAVDISEAEADPSIIGLNLDHERSAVVGRASRVWQQDDGIYASWTIARTPRGDAALADAVNPNGERRRLSGEFGPAFIKDGKLIAGHASVWGSALVPRGAFDGAMVLAADTPDEDEEEETPVELPAEQPAEPSDPDTDKEEEEVDIDPTTGAAVLAARAATIPDGAAPVAQVTEPEVRLRDVIAAIANYKSNPGDVKANQVLAALTDITFSGANSLPLGGSPIQPAWVGELYDGIPYVREYITLGKLGTNINAAGKKGFRVNRGTSGAPITSPAGIPNGGTWQGNKTEINSYNGWTETASSSLRKFAVGHDIAREFYDLPGGEPVVEAFLKLVIEDYLYWSDAWALYDIQYNAQAPVAPVTYPPIYTTNGTTALGMVLQGILAVKAKKADGRRDVPDFAIVNSLAYSQLVYAAGGDQNLPAFIDIAVNTNSQGTADGNVKIVQGDTGIQATASVIVGASSSIEFDELSGGPVIVNALDIAKGGVDRAVHGYLQTFVNRPEALVRVGTADTFAQSTAYGVGRILVYSGTTYVVSTAGTTAASNPTPPAVGATVTSGTAVLTRIA
jgi:hypothetical protein